MKVSYNITQNKFNVSFKTGYYPLPVGLENYYTKNETDLLLDNYYLKDETYSQNEIDGFLDLKADLSQLNNYYTKSETYSQDEVNGLFLNETLDTITDRGNNTENPITVGSVQSDFVQLDTTAINTYDVGKFYWNETKGTYDFGLKNNVTLQLGQEQNVYGKAYSAITNGQLVMYRTSQGGHILFEPANFTQLSANPDLIIGVATQDIALNDFGYITTFGEVNTLNTSSFSDGNTLYFGSGNFLQNTPPTGSYFIVGRVNRSHATQGSIFVKPYFVDNNLESKLNKQNNLTSDSDGTKYPTVNAVVGGLATKLDKGTYIGNASDLKSLIDTKINGSGTDNYVSKFTASGTIANSIVYDDGTNLGISTTLPSEKLDVNGYTKATGFKTPSGTATQSLTANGGTFDLNTKADLVGGKVPASQSRPSTIVMDNSTYVITFTDATGAIQTIDLPLESLFQDANYDETTKSLIVTLQDGTTRIVPLSDLVDLPEIVLATSNPAVTPTSGQKVYFNTSIGKVWFNVSGAWVFGGNLISDSEKDNLSTAYNHSQVNGNPHNTTKSDIGLGNVDNTSDLNKPISTATQTALNSKQDNLGYTPENIVNKSDSYTASSSTTYASTKALVDGLATKQNILTNPITGTGTTNYIPKFTASGTVGNSLIYDNGTNIGIGTTLPQRTLQVNAVNTPAIRLNNSNSNQGIEMLTQADRYSWFIGAQYNVNGGFEITPSTAVGGTTFSTPAMAILQTGNVGIGTTSPNEKLTVFGKGFFKPIVIPSVLGGQASPYYGTNITLGADQGSAQSAIRIWGAYSGGTNAATIFERATNTQSYGNDPQTLTYAESMRISGNGNVGIGTTSPSEKLDVNGNVLVQGFLKLKPQTSEPTGVEGAIYYNSTTKKHYGFDGTTWNALY